MKGKYKKFIKEVYNGKHGDICSYWKRTLETELPELFENGLKVGDFAIVSQNPHPQSGTLIRLKRGNGGFDFFSKKLNGSIGDSFHHHHLRKPTETEIKKHLILEAKRRGVWDIPIIMTCGAHGNSVNYFGPKYDPKKDRLWSTFGIVYEKGKWVSPLETITKEEAEKRLGLKIKY